MKAKENDMQREQMFVKPAPGRVVRDPSTGLPLPEGGAVVEKTQFWLRRLRDGDVEKIHVDRMETV